MEECLHISECHKRRCTVCPRRRLVTHQVSYRLSVEYFTFACPGAENNKQFSFENARLWSKKYYEKSKRLIPNHEILGAQHLSFIMLKR